MRQASGCLRSRRSNQIVKRKIGEETSETGSGTISEFGCPDSRAFLHAWISGESSSLGRAKSFQTCAETLSPPKPPRPAADRRAEGP